MDGHFPHLNDEQMNNKVGVQHPHKCFGPGFGCLNTELHRVFGALRFVKSKQPQEFQKSNTHSLDLLICFFPTNGGLTKTVGGRDAYSTFCSDLQPKGHKKEKMISLKVAVQFWI